MIARTPRGRPRALPLSGRPALALQLLEVRLERQRGRRAQRGGRVVPDVVEQLVARAQPARERVEQAALTVEAMSDVLVELGVRVPHDRPVAGAERVEVERAQLPQRLAGRRPARRRPAR